MTMDSDKKLVIMFACIHNAGRSQMACALFNKYKKQPNIVGISAGTEPADHVHENVVKVMNLLHHIDLSQVQPTKLTPELASTVNTIVTMGCNEKCPYVPGVKIIDWHIADPKNGDLDATITIHNTIESLVKEFIKINCF
jgi:arsenate reductase